MGSGSESGSTGLLEVGLEMVMETLSESLAAITRAERTAFLAWRTVDVSLGAGRRECVEVEGRKQRLWLPLVGPTAFLAWTQLYDLAPRSEALVKGLAGALGVPVRKYQDTLGRLEEFGLFTVEQLSVVVLPSVVPLPSARQLKRLSDIKV